MTKRKTRIERTVVCSEEYGVTRVVSEGGRSHRREPCAECPWRMDVPTGVFPPKAFQTSAPTAYDAARESFACHMSGAEKPATCAGFLLRHANHNIGVRLSQMAGTLDLSTVTDGGHPVYPSYREMAIANGVDPDDPVLVPVRS